MSARIRYRIEVLDPNAHLYAVTLQVERPASRQKVSLPVWIPGSYLVREFSQHLHRLSASQGKRSVALHQLNKNGWQADTVQGKGTLTLRYEIYAFDTSVRTAFLDADRGFFNPTSLCLRVWGREDEPHAIEIVHGPHTRGWQLATGLSPVQTGRHGFGHYQTACYDELADCPVEMGRFWSGSFKVRGITHRFVVSGAGAWFDGERLLRDTRAICEAQIAFWHGIRGKPPFSSYLFLLNATQDGYGGLEHRNSTALICQRADLPRLPEAGHVDGSSGKLKASDGYTGLLGLISHEYFHAWNVKRLRPREFTRYDYERENHTRLLWFFEGFTSYYDDLFLRRAGLIDDATYLQLLTKTLRQVWQTPGRHVHSVAQSSFEAWTKYYRVHENTPNATVSYYTKGALVALCLDWSLRLTPNASTGQPPANLDEVMRGLWQRCQGGPMGEADLHAVVRQVAGRSKGNPLVGRLAEWVHGMADLPVAELAQAMGLQWKDEPAPVAQRLGLRAEEPSTTTAALRIKTVLRGMAAEAAGLAAGDEWIGIELEPVTPGATAEAWRLRKLDDLLLYIGPRRQFTALVARDARLLRCPMAWPAPATLPAILPSAVTPPHQIQNRHRASPPLWQAWLQDT